jgi:hypothetical protein
MKAENQAVTKDELIDRLRKHKALCQQLLVDIIKYDRLSLNTIVQMREDWDTVVEMAESGHCPCRVVFTAQVRELMTGPAKLGLQEQRQRAIGCIQAFTKDATKIIVVDPYLYGRSQLPPEQIARDFSCAASLDSGQVRAVHLVHGEVKSQPIREAIRKSIEDAGIEVTESRCKDIHDRLWIVDNSRAIATGTSLNGLGNKVSFISEIEKQDIDQFLEYLAKI